jgi:hypothetical protein
MEDWNGERAVNLPAKNRYTYSAALEPSAKLNLPLATPLAVQFELSRPVELKSLDCIH